MAIWVGARKPQQVASHRVGFSQSHGRKCMVTDRNAKVTVVGLLSQQPIKAGFQFTPISIRCLMIVASAEKTKEHQPGDAGWCRRETDARLLGPRAIIQLLHKEVSQADLDDIFLRMLGANNTDGQHQATERTPAARIDWAPLTAFGQRLNACR